MLTGAKGAFLITSNTCSRCAGCSIIIHRLLGLNVLRAIQLKCIGQHGFVTTEYKCIYSSAYPYSRLCEGSVKGFGNWGEGSFYYYVKFRRP